MRRKIVHVGAGQLTYEIRQIVGVARQIEGFGRDIKWENIGDPVEKGVAIEPWMKEIITELTSDDLSYRYADSQGVPETRQFLADLANSRKGAGVNADDIIFFNGLGDAVAKIFGFLKREARIIGPSPAYSTHSSAEAAHSGYEHLTYTLDPNNNWLPDLEDLRNKVKYNDSIAGILLINPDNPTGIVYSRELLQEIVDIAARHDLFIIADETYCNVVFPGVEFTYINEVIGKVPAISMKSVSKEYPWPGARCGWIEVYNRDRDEEFDTYILSLINAKRLEVCSTTLPQLSIPPIMGDARYPEHIAKQSAELASRAAEAFSYMKDVDGVSVIMPQGALYFTVLFEEGVLNENQHLKIAEDDIREYIEKITSGMPLDKRFVYYLLGAEGICVVPLTGFCSELKGFRFTLLEIDAEKRSQIYRAIAARVKEFLGSD
ncbi:MAG: pyridoxal phosphate-dependent aminotransferase [Spirochaetales bacterium]|uniref:alanine transaminase n=1 Tax=Candidatus Thalassospirochaeta sargassi TaxID=3119039 RepID=A0AAJ1IA20_9SPIO|nr:pyridoxal phosphate-dependent aminotransferase [Spirochaetales bacterium]